MNLYLITREGHTDWDETRGIVVCSKTYQEIDQSVFDKFAGSPVKVEWLGEAADTVEEGVVLEDFKAG